MLRWLGCLVVLFSCSAPVAAAEAAALPVDGPGLLPAVRNDLDAQIHAALIEVGFVLQPSEKTQRFVEDAVRSGLDCSLQEEDCALKAAIAASVDDVVVSRAFSIDGHLMLEMRKVNANGLPVRVVVGAIGQVDNGRGEGVVTLAERLRDARRVSNDPLPLVLGLEPSTPFLELDGAKLPSVVVVSAGKGRRVLWLRPGRHRIAIAQGGYESRTVDVDIKADQLPPPINVVLVRAQSLASGVAVAMLVVGGVLVVGGGTGATITEALLHEPQTPKSRGDLTQFGRVMLGATAVGLFCGTIGAAMAIGGTE